MIFLQHNRKDIQHSVFSFGCTFLWSITLQSQFLPLDGSNIGFDFVIWSGGSLQWICRFQRLQVVSPLYPRVCGWANKILETKGVSYKLSEKRDDWACKEKKKRIAERLEERKIIISTITGCVWIFFIMIFFCQFANEGLVKMKMDCPEEIQFMCSLDLGVQLGVFQTGSLIPSGDSQEEEEK